MRANRSAVVGSGQLTSGLRSDTSRRAQRGTFTDVQIQSKGDFSSKSPRVLSSVAEIHSQNNNGMTFGDKNVGDLRADKRMSIDSDQSSEKLITPQLRVPSIPGGMRRETTSFGVFSNLSSHNRPKYTQQKADVEDVTLAKPGPQMQLLKAVKNGDLKQVNKILVNNSTMDLNFADDEGNTVLHQGIFTGSDEIMELLLSRRPPVNISNKIGETALHIAASHGREHITYMLLQNGADVNLQHQVTGLTALHQAVSEGHRHMVDLLLCCGADPTKTSKDGRAAKDRCNEKCSTTNFEQSLELVSAGGMVMKELGTTTPAHLKSLGMVIEPREQMQTTCVVCRRCGVSSRDMSSQLAVEEDIVSDQFFVRLAKCIANFKMIITIPIYNGASAPGEQVVVKTNGGQEIIPTEIWKENETYLCKFNTTAGQTESYFAICRPTTEQYIIDKTTSIVTSAVNPAVKIHVGRNSFTKPSKLSIQLLEMNEDIEIAEGGEILSSTPFYKIDSDEPLSKPIDIELPQPFEYGEEQGQTVILTKETSDGRWNIVDKAKTDKQGTVAFSVTSLPVYAVVLKCKTSYGNRSVVKEIQQTFQQLMTQSRMICFLCLTKGLRGSKTFKVVVECCEVKLADSRRRYWIGQGFTEQQERGMIDHFSFQSKQAFTVSFYENIVFRQGAQTSTLEFHPKRNNAVKFDVNATNDDAINGRVYVHQRNNGVGVRVPNETNDDDLVTSIDISLVTIKTQEKPPTPKINRSSTDAGLVDQMSSRGSMGSRAGVRISAVSLKSSSEPDKITEGSNRSISTAGSYTESEEKSGKSNQSTSYMGSNELLDPKVPVSSVFLTDDFLDKLVVHMEDDWYKIFVLMGISFAEIEELLLKNGAPVSSRQKLFKDWRDSHAEREDVGIPFLLSALFKGGRRDVANTIQVYLKKWHDNTNDKSNGLHGWLEKAHLDSNLFVPTDYPKPMSDGYLVLMADDLVPTHDLGKQLSLLETEVEDIRNNNSYLYPALKVMKMLVVFRETIPSKIDALKKLVECLDKLNYDKLKGYAIMCAKAWVKRTATRKDDPFRTQVDSLMSKMN